MDGIDSFPHQNPAEGSNGDEPACVGVQPKTSAEHLRNAKADCVHERLGQGSIHIYSHQSSKCRDHLWVRRYDLSTCFHTASTQTGQSRTRKGDVQRVVTVIAYVAKLR